MAKKFKFADWEFDTQKELDLTIKTIFNECPRNVEFENEFLLTIINTLHKGVKKYGLTCTKLKLLEWDYQTGVWEFVRERFRGGLFVIGFFEPIKKWHGVTVYPHKKTTVKQNLINALRQKWSESAKKRDPNARCEVCNRTNPQLHHDNIGFKEIAEKCIIYFSEEEIKYGVGDDWWKHESEADAIPNNHPAVEKMLELHEKVKYKWLCFDCHKREAE